MQFVYLITLLLI